MKISTKNLTTFAWIFLVTGFFTTSVAILLFSKVLLFQNYSAFQLLAPASQLIIAGPFSLISGFLLFDKYKRGIIFGLVTSGVFIFYAVTIFFENRIGTTNESLWSLLPAILGLMIAFTFIFRVMKNTRYV
jgi:hypothetical protein